MRTAVVGALFFQNSASSSGLDRAFLASLKLGATTHGDPRCLISCAIASGLVAAMMRDDQPLQTEADVRRVVTAALAFFDACPDFPDKLSEEQRTELERYVWPATLAELELDERSSIGYTFKCLGAGMWSLRKAIEWRAEFDASGDTTASVEGGVHERDIFERVITDITNEGGDADTNAVVAGALVGTFLGVRGLCYRWAVGLGEGERPTIFNTEDESGVSVTRTEREKIPLRQWLTQKGEAASSLLGIASTSTPGVRSIAAPASYNHLEDPDTLLYGYEGAQPLTDKEMDDLMWGKVMQGMVERLGYADDPKYNQPVVVSRKQWKEKVNKGDCVVM